ncbi:hypothetical protein D3C84_748170 [compost metagenome]
MTAVRNVALYRVPRVCPGSKISVKPLDSMGPRHTPRRFSATCARFSRGDMPLSSRWALASIRKVCTSSRISSLALLMRSTWVRPRWSNAGFSSSNSQEVAKTINGVRNSWLTSLVNNRSRVRAWRKRPSVASNATASSPTSSAA